MNLLETNQNVILYNELNTTVDYDLVQQKITENDNLSMLCQSFHIQQYKKVNNLIYVVIHTSKGLAIIFFDSGGNNPYMQLIKFSGREYESGISALKKNMSLQEAMEADPDGQFDFIFHSWSEYPQISYHYFESGNCYIVMYENNIISNIIFLTI